MSFLELVEKVSKETGASMEVVSGILKTFSKVVTEVTEEGENVKVLGLGCFYTKKASPRPLFGGTRMSSPRSTLRFRQSRRSRGEARRSNG